jgi:hypothetical protein
MTQRQQWVVLGALGATYFLGLGVLIGIVNERFRYDAVRGRIVSELQDATRRVKAHAMAFERDAHAGEAPAAMPATAPKPPGWRIHLAEVNVALTRGDVSAADRAWREAHIEAVRTRAWLPLAEVGDAALRIGKSAAHRGPYEAKARDLYMGALIRARAERSVEGVQHVAGAFETLGDRSVAEQCRIIADSLSAARDNRVNGHLRRPPAGLAVNQAMDGHAPTRMEP